MLRVIKANWIAAACVLFVLVNAFLVVDRFYWLNALPAVLLIVWAMLTAADRLLIFIAFATPLSINLEDMDLGGLGIALPTEPLMVGLMVLFILKVALERNVLDERVWRHPITWVVLAQLIWMAVCIVPSSMLL